MIASNHSSLSLPIWNRANAWNCCSTTPTICRRSMPKYEAERLAGQHRIHECQTPVFLWVELADGRIQVHAWVAPEAPTVKGFVGIARELFAGSPRR